MSSIDAGWPRQSEIALVVLGLLLLNGHLLQLLGVVSDVRLESPWQSVLGDFSVNVKAIIDKMAQDLMATMATRCLIEMYTSQENHA